MQNTLINHENQKKRRIVEDNSSSSNNPSSVPGPNGEDTEVTHVTDSFSGASLTMHNVAAIPSTTKPEPNDEGNKEEAKVMDIDSDETESEADPSDSFRRNLPAISDIPIDQQVCSFSRFFICLLTFITVSCHLNSAIHSQPSYHCIMEGIYVPSPNPL